MKNKIIVSVVGIAIILCAWAPWLTQERVEQLVIAQYNTLWQGVLDNPGVSGVTDFTKIPFGAKGSLVYTGGLAERSNVSSNKGTTVFVSFLGTVHGLKSPEDIFKGR